MRLMATRKSPAKEGQPAAGGKRRLIEAALRLGARSRSLHGLGLRELAREAELNPNTFYRHFRDMDHLGEVLIEEIGKELRQTLRGIRRSAERPELVASRTVEYAFEFAAKNPDMLIVGVREMHGSSPGGRKALRRMIAEIADETVEDVRYLKLLPRVDDATMSQIATVIVEQMFFRALDYLERPKERAQIVRQTVRFIEILFAGAMVLQVQEAAKSPPIRK
jgi:AcrR family transcriptional regulator